MLRGLISLYFTAVCVDSEWQIKRASTYCSRGEHYGCKRCCDYTTDCSKTKKIRNDKKERREYDASNQSVGPTHIYSHAFTPLLMTGLKSGS
jgi:hypothetical protein